jgi:hypothetical protein
MVLMAIREAVRARPFQQFRMNLVDGRQFVVPHPDIWLCQEMGGALWFFTLRTIP